MRARTQSIFLAIATVVPLAFIHGVIEFTTTIRFGPAARVTDLGVVTEAARQGDVVRALGLGLAFHLALWLSLAVPYLSLVRSYAKDVGEELVTDVVLRRFFLISLPWAVLSLAAWLAPTSLANTMPSVILVLMVLCYALLMRTLKRTAQIIANLSEGFSWLLVGLAFAVHVLLSAMVYTQISGLMPPELREAIQ